MKKNPEGQPPGSFLCPPKKNTMHIDPRLTAEENIFELVTNPALGQPTIPELRACTAAVPYNRATLNEFTGPGLNVDGVDSNTQVIVYLRPDVDDVSNDGINQTIIYQRKTLAETLPANPTVVLHGPLTSNELVDAIATSFGLVAEEILLLTPLNGEPATVQIDSINSLLYLQGPVTVTLNWS
jgi:hypothetical protein